MTSVWYLSFCDGDKPKGEQFLCGCMVEADSPEAAITLSHLSGCNPGGEVALWQLPDGPDLRAEMQRNGWSFGRLIRREEMGDVVSISETEAHGHGPDASACQCCNKSAEGR